MKHLKIWAKELIWLGALATITFLLFSFKLGFGFLDLKSTINIGATYYVILNSDLFPLSLLTAFFLVYSLRGIFKLHQYASRLLLICFSLVLGGIIFMLKGEMDWQSILLLAPFLLIIVWHSLKIFRAKRSRSFD